jgi:hypothetical protein
MVACAALALLLLDGLAGRGDAALMGDPAIRRTARIAVVSA